jgi:hypothetical protein
VWAPLCRCPSLVTLCNYSVLPHNTGLLAAPSTHRHNSTRHRAQGTRHRAARGTWLQQYEELCAKVKPSVHCPVLQGLPIGCRTPTKGAILEQGASLWTDSSLFSDLVCGVYVLHLSLRPRLAPVDVYVTGRVCYSCHYEERSTELYNVVPFVTVPVFNGIVLS